jgi:hypothetical protein
MTGRPDGTISEILPRLSFKYFSEMERSIMMKHDGLDFLYEYDVEKLMRDTGTKLLPDVYGKIVGSYPPGEFCGLVLDIAGLILEQYPGMTREECESALLTMEYDHEYCIAVEGEFGLPNHKPFQRFELQFAGALIQMGRQRSIAPLDGCKEVVGFGVQLLRQASTSGKLAEFKAFKQDTGHIWFHLAGGHDSMPNNLLRKMVILVEEINGSVRCALGGQREDVFVNYPLIKR